MLLHHRRQPIHALPEVHGPRRNQHPSPARYGDHADLSAPRTARSMRSSTLPRTVTWTAPGNAISILPIGFASLPNCSVATADRLSVSFAPAITTGTRSGCDEATPSLALRCPASRRHV